MKKYDHTKIEKAWQKSWDTKKVYATEAVSKKKKHYVLDMFPYPSGAGLHVGHPRGYIGSDVYARMKRMEGFNVLHPMGYDAFGLPAEQYAIEHKVHPRKAVEKNIATFRGQLDKIGFSYDWSRAVNTTDPEYYKWTQWIFLELYNSYYDTEKNKARPIADLIKKFSTKGGEDFTGKEWKGFSKKEQQDILMKYRLAYEGYAEVNWCPQLGTVLANDEIVDDKQGNPVSERGGYPVEKKSMRQWFMRITSYADRLISDLDTLDWSSHIKEIQKNWIGKEVIDGKTTYNIRDAIFARQRYWGEPIPLVHDEDGIISEVKEKNLPLTLPNVTSYEPTGTGESPLASVKSWVKAGYETNTMPGWAGSSWYFLRYMDPTNKKAFADKKHLKYWKEVDMYVGGQEHATGHLLYARFWHKFLFDMGYVPTAEPFRAMKNQGMILATDGRKMSKRWGNVINPDEIVKNYGADTLRVYEMFMGPFEASQPWSTESIIGSRRFIERVWKLGAKVATQAKQNQENLSRVGTPGERVKRANFADSVQLETILHKTIKKVTNDIKDFAFNTSISSMMICINEMEKVVSSKYEVVSVKDFKMFLQILAPFAPHMTEELWHELGEKNSIHLSKWPKYNEKKIVEETLKIGVSVNGKVRAELAITPEMTEEEIKAMAHKDEAVIKWLEGKEIKRTIYVKDRLVNIVV